MLPSFFLFWLSVTLAYFSIDLILFTSVLKIKKRENKNNPQNLKGISVIVAAHNEEKNLDNYLERVLNQNYPLFEVIVINDNSDDDTQNILLRLEKKHPSLKIIHLQDTKKSKKLALTKGIEVSEFDVLCFTDADCYPKTSEWLSSMVSYVSTETPIVLGYSPFEKYSGLLNKLIRFENIQTAINYFALSNLGLPYMGVGRNIMYKKEVFNVLNGFENHKHTLSGDDDLFVNNAVKHYKLSLCLERKSFVYSQPKRRLSSWLSQKKRHYTTSYHYQRKHQFILGFQFIVRCLFWLMLFSNLLVFSISSLNLNSILTFVLGLIMINAIGRFVIYKKFGAVNLVIASYYLEILLVIFQLYLFFSQLFKPKKDW
jgi:cellulose synthase/poly-beta-1,6-N-acetylglucosamine synthase-like glycosyltransferase